MCGIANIVELNNRDVNVNDIHSMMSAMNYRGPDDDGYIVDKKIVGTYNNHIKGKCSEGKEVWKCIHLELWFRQYID